MSNKDSFAKGGSRKLQREKMFVEDYTNRNRRPSVAYAQALGNDKNDNKLQKECGLEEGCDWSI